MSRLASMIRIRTPSYNNFILHSKDIIKYYPCNFTIFNQHNKVNDYEYFEQKFLKVLQNCTTLLPRECKIGFFLHFLILNCTHGSPSIIIIIIIAAAEDISPTILLTR